jgi:hypothetical protein
VLEDEVVDLVLLCRIGGRGVEAVDFDSAVVACGCEVLVGGVEGDALDVALVVGQRLQLLERVPRPHDHLRVESDGDEDGRVSRPAEVLHIVFVAYEAADDAPVLDGRGFVGACGH